MKKHEIKKEVKKKYGQIAKTSGSCGCSAQISSCCGSTSSTLSKRIGYSDEELSGIPQSADLGLGCGNPTANASIKEGDTVLDLGSGAGIDCFLAARKVGKSGKVIGLDMTPEMVNKARENARKGNYTNVEFRLGEIEQMPVDSNSVNVIISNCVINLSTNKDKVFKEAFRVLKAGGKLFISDLVLLKELPEAVKNSVEAYSGCIAGASFKDKYLEAMKKAGFKKVEILSETRYPIENMANDATAQAVMKDSHITSKDIQDIANSVASIKVTAQK